VKIEIEESENKLKIERGKKRKTHDFMTLLKKIEFKFLTDLILFAGFFI